METSQGGGVRQKAHTRYKHLVRVFECETSAFGDLDKRWQRSKTGSTNETFKSERLGYYNIANRGSLYNKIKV